jgi:hypothetical protein
LRAIGEVGKEEEFAIVRATVTDEVCELVPGKDNLAVNVLLE